ncbi:MAG: LysM peptidoglycan-binding domain-containing protein [Alteromonadaceae bacterium]|nr:LysM peptidoglycan-binding domain-containing protein [Alteromonadaceae bacterium]
MLKKILLIVLSVSFSMFIVADELTIKPNAPKSYVVKKGDTLWDISEVFLKKPWLWPKLWRWNPEIKNPHLIYPGDKLSLVYDKQGQPMLVKGKPVLKWSPKVRPQLKDQNPITTLPLSVITPYIKYDSIITEEQIEALPYVIGSDEGYTSSVEGFKVYVKGELEVGKSYAIYQKGGAIIDPQTGDKLGNYSTLVGTAKAIRAGDLHNKVPATLYVDNVKQGIRSGYYVMPVNEGQLLPSYFTMQAANKSVRGMIIKSSTGGREFGKLEVVMINRGHQHAILQGDVLSIKRKSPGVIETGNGPVYSKDASDFVMPEEMVGKLMIFKVYPKVSMGLILKTKKSVRFDDVVTSPSRI